MSPPAAITPSALALGVRHLECVWPQGRGSCTVLGGRFRPEAAGTALPSPPSFGKTVKLASRVCSIGKRQTCVAAFGGHCIQVH